MRHNNEVLRIADGFACDGDVSMMYGALRSLTLADFCMLHLTVPSDFHHLKLLLPKQPTEEIQKRWVGESGLPLMIRSCNLLRLFDSLSWRTNGTGLNGKRILDYGCGYGRLLRLMNYFSDYNNVVGCDAMMESLDICNASGLHNKTVPVDARPNGNMEDSDEFDFIYLFSVFSHTPIELTQLILEGLRGRTSGLGIVVCTIRTIEWLSVRNKVWPSNVVSSMEREYLESGYSFLPLNGEKGALHQSDYGDTIVTPAHFGKICRRAGWEVVTFDRDLSEPFQIAVVLKKL